MTDVLPDDDPQALFYLESLCPPCVHEIESNIPNMPSYTLLLNRATF